MKTAVILNSRQSLRPVGSDAWIANTICAVQDAISNGCTILTSVGMNSWEISLFLASKRNANIIVYVPLGQDGNEKDVRQYYSDQFKLSDKYTDWRFIEIESMKKDKDKFQQQRDLQIIMDADIIYPISIRPHGNMAKLIEQSASFKKINTDYQADYESKKHSYKIEIDKNSVNPDIDRHLDNYIIHWTRSSNNPWPGETLYDYYESIVNSNDRYPRSALDTLNRILSEKRLRASSRHMRRGVSAVAFSALKPSEAVKLMKWRARYSEMTFEPYGIAIQKDYALRIGIKKVIYGNPEMYRYLEEKDRPYFQSLGQTGDWQPEREYRGIGDIDLKNIPHEYIRAIVRTKDEIKKIKNHFNGEILFLGN